MDLSKCAGVGCPIRDGCDRFVRPAVDGQRWIEPAWCDLPSPLRGYPEMLCSKRSCLDWEPVDASQVYIPGKIDVQPHGGAREEGDGA